VEDVDWDHLVEGKRPVGWDVVNTLMKLGIN
jgi:hypothetical protein